MKIGKTERYIKDRINKEGAMLFTLIDPCDHPSPEKAAKAAAESVDAGADLVLVGGSIGAQGALLDDTIVQTKEQISVPLVIFPGNISTVSGHADAIYFMSLLNSRNTYWVSMAQALAAPVIKKIGLEPLPVGYIVVEPGGTVGWVGDANVVPRHKPNIAVSLALGGEFSGCRFIITDVGSASQPGPVPYEMVRQVRGVLDPEIPYICAGGIRTAEQAGKIIKNGADAIHIGTALEKTKNVKTTIGGIAKAVKKAGKDKC
jgi:phosphoglycerol geranylgeranyltransferase